MMLKLATLAAACVSVANAQPSAGTGKTDGDAITAAALLYKNGAFSCPRAGCVGTCTETASTSVAADKALCEASTVALTSPTACEVIDTTAADDGAAKACTFTLTKKQVYTTTTIGSGAATLQSLAQGTGTADTGDTIDAYILSALDGTGLFAEASCTGTAATAVSGETSCATLFAAAPDSSKSSCPQQDAGCTYAYGSYGGDTDARQEAAAKGVLNSLMVHLSLTEAAAAVAAETANPGDGADGWNKAWAIYGYLGATSEAATPYATANKRCKNMDTCDSAHPKGGSSSDDEAKTNVAIASAFAGGASEANLQLIKDNLAVTYISASLRYANKMDADMAGGAAHEEHQGEGHAFYQVLKTVDDHDDTLALTTADAIMDYIYVDPAITGLTGRYCEALTVLTPLVPAATYASDAGVAPLGTLSEATSLIDQTCHASDATGRTAGQAITAAAKTFKDACGDTDTLASCKTAYTDTTIAGADAALNTLQELAQDLDPALDAFIISAVDSTGIFADDAAIGFLGGRKEAVKKGVMNWLMSALAVKYAKDAACVTGTASAEIYSKAAAVYGNPIVDSASVSATPQATANKRCQNYGTCVTDESGDTATGKYQAATNIAIMNAFQAATPANVAIIQEQIKVTYIQAALRYLNKMDSQLIANIQGETREYQGEGLAFFKVGEAYLGTQVAAVIEGLYTPVIAADPDGDDASTYSYDATTNYCRGLKALETQASAAQIGTLTEASSQVCTGATYSGCTAQVTLATTGSCAIVQPACVATDAKTSAASVAAVGLATFAAVVAAVVN